MADAPKRTIVTEGDFAGWTVAEVNENFNALVGPYYYRQEADGKIKVAFKAEKRHLNGGGTIHGGCLLTLADTALFIFALPVLEGGGAVTVQLDAQFQSAGRLDDIVVASGEVTRAGKTLIFARGDLHCADRLLTSFTGILARKAPAGSRDG